MITKILINLDLETKRKLDDLAKDSDKSSEVRKAILFAWDVKNNSIRVPVEGKLNNHTVISDEEYLERR
jgi:hypothetical protein